MFSLCCRRAFHLILLLFYWTLYWPTSVVYIGYGGDIYLNVSTGRGFSTNYICWCAFTCWLIIGESGVSSYWSLNSMRLVISIYSTRCFDWSIDYFGWSCAFLSWLYACDQPLLWLLLIPEGSLKIVSTFLRKTVGMSYCFSCTTGMRVILS
jgi:hypothetical protein